MTYNIAEDNRWESPPLSTKMLPLIDGAGYKLFDTKMLSLTDGARNKLFGTKMLPHLHMEGEAFLWSYAYNYSTLFSQKAYEQRDIGIIQ